MIKRRVSELIHTVLTLLSTLFKTGLSETIDQYTCAPTYAHLVCENAVVTVTGWGCNHGDYKLVILWSPDWWTFGGLVLSCRKSTDTHKYTQVITQAEANNGMLYSSFKSYTGVS